MSRIGIILGAISILSLLISLFISWVDWPFALVGLILSIVGYRRNEGQLAKIGIALNTAGLLLSLGYRSLRILYIVLGFESTQLLGMLTAIILAAGIVFYLSRRL